MRANLRVNTMKHKEEEEEEEEGEGEEGGQEKEEEKKTSKEQNEETRGLSLPPTPNVKMSPEDPTQWHNSSGRRFAER